MVINGYENYKLYSIFRNSDHYEIGHVSLDIGEFLDYKKTGAIRLGSLPDDSYILFTEFEEPHEDLLIYIK